MNWYQMCLWALRIAAAVIMLQTLYFKFTGAEESVYIFSSLGMEPWGRIGTGVLELIAAALLLYPRTTVFGAAMGAGLMSGAIFFHLTRLGIAVKGDGGQLFIYALIVFSACAALLVMKRKEIQTIITQFISKS